MAGSGIGDSIHTDLVPVGSDPIDPPMGLSLVICDKCKDVRVVAFTCVNTSNKGKRFFKCPRSKEKDPTSCRFYFFQDDYVVYLWKIGKLAAGHVSMAKGSTSDVHAGATEAPKVAVEDEIKAIKEQIDSMKILVNGLRRHDVFLAGILVFGAVLLFLVGSIVFLLGVVIYIMMSN